MTMYERVGGSDWFDGLATRFYDGVAGDPILRPLYPEDLEPGRVHLRDFLIQYWGGPTHYSDERGHPRLRQRHMPFTIGTAERDAWFTHMVAAVLAGGLDEDDEAEMVRYFANAAAHLVNAQ